MKKIVLLFLLSFLVLPMTSSFATVNDERQETVKKEKVMAVITAEDQVQVCINSMLEDSDYDFRQMQFINDNISTPVQETKSLIFETNFYWCRDFCNLKIDPANQKLIKLHQDNILVSRQKSYHV